MEKEKDSIVLYGNMLRAITKLPPENCLEMMQAIAAYANREEFTFSNPILEAWFSDIVETFKRDNEQFQATCVERSEAGKKGGLKRVENMRKAQERAELENCEDRQGELEESKQTQANSSKFKQNEAKPKQTQANQAETETETDINPLLPSGSCPPAEGEDPPPKGENASFDCSIPTLDEVLEYASLPDVSVLQEEAERFFYRRAEERWRDRFGRIIDWRASLRGWKSSPFYGQKIQKSKEHCEKSNDRNAGTLNDPAKYDIDGNWKPSC